MMRQRFRVLAAALLGLVTTAGQAQEKRFLDLVGTGPVGSVTQTSPLSAPYITWGGDMATFHANGGLTTKPGSLFLKLGLNLKLTAGDDFVQQVREYRAGRTPFLRGTFHMIGLASEVIGSDPRTKGVVILQMTWSAGDHMVARQPVRTVTDLKGKTVALQQGGPHQYSPITARLTEIGDKRMFVEFHEGKGGRMGWGWQQGTFPPLGAWRADTRRGYLHNDKMNVAWGDGRVERDRNPADP